MPDPTIQTAAATTLRHWRPASVAQRSLAQSYLALLAARPDAWSRDCAPGHLTASAMVFSADLSAVALVLHGIMNIWVQPGGHLEPGDADLLSAARREVAEELGISVTLDALPVTLDCHVVQCRGYTHPTRHLDIRFAGRASADAMLVCSEESHAVRWWPVDALPDDLHADVGELIAAGRDRLLGTTGAAD
ncbi:MAG: NUDIX hydrolase [Propioniciclava sp.]